ncbi:cupin domain-containing protein [Aliiglaciecola aliphaticivorans]
MRHHIDHLSSDALPWDKLSSGVYCKMLNFNEDSGDRTALFRFVPEEGANPPSIPHYHTVYEELFILEGKMTFDHKTWLSDQSYVYHPPYLVHGFKSAVPTETIFIGRSPRNLDFNYPKAIAKDEPFYIDNKTSTRDFAYTKVPIENNWPVLIGPNQKTIGRRFVLSEDKLSKEGSCLIRFYKGLTVPVRESGYETYNEGFILEGQVEAEDGTIWRKGDYWFRHPGKPVQALKVTEDTLVYSSTGG